MSSRENVMRSTRLCLVWVFLQAGLALGQTVPATVSFTARLADSGAAVQGSRLFTFRLFPALQGGAEAWTEQQVLTVTDGNVNAELGATMPLSEVTLTGARLFLEVTVDGVVLSPRTPLLSVPYAIRTGVSNRVGTLGETDIQRRVSATCPVNSSIRSIDSSGNVTCQAATVTAAIDGGTNGITGVFGGAGLIGGGTLGDINLALNFAGSGAASTVARSDHSHLGGYLPVGASLACGSTDKVSAINPSTGSVTCTPDTGVSSVNVGAGLTGGPITGTGTIGLAASVQNWSSQPGCAAGSYLRAISASGAPTCEAAATAAGGTVTSVTAGAGLTGGTITTAGTLGLAASVQNWSSQPTCGAGTYLRSISASGVPICATDADTNSGGTVTAVVAGAGLTGGTISSSGTIGLAPTVQNWSSQPSCAVGSTISGISATGTPTCVPSLPSAFGRLAYAWVPNCTTTGTCPVDANTAFSSGGAGTITASRMGPGFYTVVFGGLTGGPPNGHIQVTGYGLGNVHCKVASWSANPVSPIILCYNGSTGALTDSAYTVLAIM